MNAMESVPVEAWSDDDHSLITRVQIVTGKYMNKFTAVGSLTIWYNGVPSQSRGVCRNLSRPEKHYVDLKAGETITSMKVYSNLIHKFVCGIAITTSSNRNFGPFGIASRVTADLKSPYNHGYYISSLSGRSGDVLMDLRANFACTYASPFTRGPAQSQLETSLPSSSTTSTISSRGSAGSGYGTDDEQNFLTAKSHAAAAPFAMHATNRFQYELENRLNGLDKPLKLADLKTVKGTKPPPPPRTTGLKSLRTSTQHVPRRNLSRNGSKGSLLTHRPILAKSNSTALTSV